MSRALSVMAAVLVLLAASSASAFVNTYSCSADGSGCAVQIPDSGCPVWVNQTITVPDHFHITEVTVPVSITHTYRGDLRLEIESPTGTVVRLANNTCSGAGNIIGTYIDGAGYSCGSSQWSPDGPGVLADFADEDSYGTWKIRACDSSGIDTGTLNDLTLSIESLDAGVYVYSNQSGASFPGMDYSYTLTVYNLTGSAGDVDLAYTGNSWTVDGPATVHVANEASADIQVTVSIPSDAEFNETDTVNVEASLGGYSNSADLTTKADEWMKCDLPAPEDGGLWWGMGWDGECLWVSNTANKTNYAFDPFTCQPCATGPGECEVSACAVGGAQWIADMAYDSVEGEMCQVAVGGEHEVFCWDPADCSCGSVHTPDGHWGVLSERGLAFRESKDTFFIAGQDSDKITEFRPGGHTSDGPQEIGGTISNAVGLAYDPIANQVWIASSSAANNIYPMLVDIPSPWTIGSPVPVAQAAGVYALAGADYVDVGDITTVAFVDKVAPGVIFHLVPNFSSTTTTTSTSSTTSTTPTTTTVPTTTTTTTIPADDDTGDDDTADDTSDDAADDTADDVADDSADDAADDATDDSTDDAADDFTADDDAADDAEEETTDDESTGCCG